jgi:hypothetical protein
MNSKASSTYWQEVLKSPEGIVVNEPYIDRTAINSVAVITGRSWQSLVRLLVDQAHFRCNLPTYKTCVTDMLRASGFKPIHGYTSIKEVVRDLNGKISDGKSYIVQLSSGAYYALVPDQRRGLYVFKGCKPATATLDNRGIDNVWEYIPGSDNRTGITRKPKHKSTAKEATALENKNENPAGRLIGDCVVRAFATLLDCSWHDALDILAQTSDYTNPCINAHSNINNTLTRLGFTRFSGVKIGKRYANGKHMCSVFNATYHDGERIFAQIGQHHCATIVPTESEGYKIQDTWDSTSREIIEYWVLCKNKVEKKSRKSIQYIPGSTVKHPVFGEGMIKSYIHEGSSRFFEIEFPTVGIKKVSADWLAKNALS